MSQAPVAAGPRIAWAAVPGRVHAGVESSLGSPIVEAVAQQGGFSPGAAVRVRLADGRRAFVKAVGTDLNPESPDIYRAEGRALAALPDHVPAARLLSTYDDGDWVALMLVDVAGRQPRPPWSDDDVAAVVDTLHRVAATEAPAALPAFAERVSALTAWDLVDADPTGVDTMVLERLPDLLRAQELARDVTRGTALVHWDARADNVLVEPGGRAVLLDWAWACRGAPWLDLLMLAANFRIQGGPDADRFLATDPLTRSVDPQHLRAVVACLLGVWSDRARHPAPPGLPTIREWQSHCAALALRWLDEGALWS